MAAIPAPLDNTSLVQNLNPNEMATSADLVQAGLQLDNLTGKTVLVLPNPIQENLLDTIR